MPVPTQRPRVGGVFTAFHWDDGTGERIIAFADTVQVQGVRPVADAQVVQPLNALRPIEIVTPGAHTEGRIIITLTDLYNQAVWQRLAGLASSNDIADIMRTVAAMGNGIKLSKYVNPPVGVGASQFSSGPYLETYHECVVVRAQDDETIRVDTMTINKEIEVWFAYSKKHWINSSRNPADMFA